MKKVKLMMLSMLIVAFILGGCGAGSDEKGASGQETEVNTTMENAVNSEASKPDETEAPAVTPEPTEEPKPVFEECKDLKIVSSFIYDKNQYVVVENVGEQAILEFGVAYINFDKNGFPMSSGEYDKGRYESANMMPGDKCIGSWYGAEGLYSEAVVSKVKYADGTEWETELLDVWQENTLKTFSVENCEQRVKELAADAEKAYECETADLSNVSVVHGNRYSTSKDYQFKISNLSAQGILGVQLYVLEYDENGFPVSVSPYDKYCKNGHTTGGTINLAAGSAGSYENDLFIEGETEYTKEIITQIEFQDGSTWVNPYMYEWIIYNHNTYFTETKENAAEANEGNTSATEETPLTEEEEAYQTALKEKELKHYTYAKRLFAQILDYKDAQQQYDEIIAILAPYNGTYKMTAFTDAKYTMEIKDGEGTLKWDLVDSIYALDVFGYDFDGEGEECMVFRAVYTTDGTMSEWEWECDYDDVDMYSLHVDTDNSVMVFAIEGNDYATYNAAGTKK